MRDPYGDNDPGSFRGDTEEPSQQPEHFWDLDESLAEALRSANVPIGHDLWERARRLSADTPGQAEDFPATDDPLTSTGVPEPTAQWAYNPFDTGQDALYETELPQHSDTTQQLHDIHPLEDTHQLPPPPAEYRSDPVDEDEQDGYIRPVGQPDFDEVAFSFGAEPRLGHYEDDAAEVEVHSEDLHDPRDGEALTAIADPAERLGQHPEEHHWHRGPQQPKRQRHSSRRAHLVVAATPKVDLLPPELKDAKKARAARGYAALIVVLIAAAMVGLSYLTWQDAQQESALRAVAEQRGVELLLAQSEFEEARELADQVEAIDKAAGAASSTHISWFDFLADLREALPGQVRVTTIEIEAASPLYPYPQPEGPTSLSTPRAGAVTFTAESQDVPQISDWLRGLQDVPGFIDATPSSVVEGTEEDDTGYSVTITMHIDENLFITPEVAK